MIYLYDEKDYEKAVALKNKLLLIYFAAFGVCFSLCALFFILFLLMPYASSPELVSRKDLYMFLDCAISVLFAAFSFVYLCIPYRRAKYYLKMLNDIKYGEKVRDEGTFLQNYLNVSVTRHVDFYAMATLEWSERSQEYVRRNVFVDKEKEMPNLKNGDMIVYYTHANVLVSYGLKDEEVFSGFEGKEE